MGVFFLTRAESHLTSVRTSFSKAATTPLMLCSASASSGLMKDPAHIVCTIVENVPATDTTSINSGKQAREIVAAAGAAGAEEGVP